MTHVHSGDGQHLSQIETLMQVTRQFAYAAAPANGLIACLGLSMLCIMTASFRATATAVRFEAPPLTQLQPPDLKSAFGPDSGSC